MKWIFYVLVFIYMFYRTVYGIKTIHKETRSLTIEPITYENDKGYFETGIRKSLTCKGANKNQKVEWIDPSGKVVQRVATNRVFTQEHFVPTFRSRVPAMVLTFTHTLVEDTGVWECRSGDLSESISMCIIDPSEFLDTPTEVSVDRGRSITLSCQARGEPEPRLIWVRDDTIISDDFRPFKYQIMTKYNSRGFEGLLTITSLEGEDSGIYNCIAIQESPLVDGCSASITLNITLNVNYLPTFAEGNDTTLVPAQKKESVELVCAADGYPTPTYRWFKEVGDILSEYASADIKIKDDGEKAILTLIADESTFGQRYRCRATNKYGIAEKVFAIIKLEKPTKPNLINYGNNSYNELELLVIWPDDMYASVNDVRIQYIEAKTLKRKGAPREADWRLDQEVEMYVNTDDMLESEGLHIQLSDLKEETTYWVRINGNNEAGGSPWSDPILASTSARPEEEETLIEVDETEVPETAARISNGTFYGVFFAGGIILVIIGSTFIIRMV